MTRRWQRWSSIWSSAWSRSSARGGSACARPGGCCRARAARGREAEACGRASARLERLEVLGALAAIAQLGRSGPQAGGVRALPLIAQQVGDRLAARLLAQVAGVVLAPLLPAAERSVGDQGSTRRLTQRSATTKAAAVRIAIHASSAARPRVTVPPASARHTFTAWVSGRSQANERAHGGRLSSGKKTPEKRNITEMPSGK